MPIIQKGGPPTQEPTPIIVTSADAKVAAVAAENTAGGYAISGTSDKGVAIYGHSVEKSGVEGESQNADAVLALSHSAKHAGVSAQNDAGGFGLWASTSGGIAVFGESPSNDAIQGLSHAAQHAGVSGTNDAGGFGVWAKGTPAGYFVGDVHVTGTLTVDVDLVLTGAADFAEEFDVESIEIADPGTVMVLTEDGGVRPCHSAYDHKVAGVVSGAGEYKPGLVLDRRPDAGKPRRALALVGKVYCKVDASYGAIAVGDLLTTSPTSGHAMKATDPARSFGARIGKALAPIVEGQGLVPVLVALQ
jgi:hypothetical protein